MDRMEAAISALLERSKPRANCILCGDEGQADGHSTAGCPKYRDPITKAVQAVKVAPQPVALPYQKGAELPGKKKKILTSPGRPAADVVVELVVQCVMWLQQWFDANVFIR
ncbi:hypothetical protein Q1695_013917 [Nippostrongylus brasiliensis]|nr:hypothetical protein Q1695_013917 [Nippostrongylus brasiliensis]